MLFVEIWFAHLCNKYFNNNYVLKAYIKGLLCFGPTKRYTVPIVKGSHINSNHGWHFLLCAMCFNCILIYSYTAKKDITALSTVHTKQAQRG